MELKNRYEIRLRYKSFDQDSAKDLKEYVEKLTKKCVAISFLRLPVQKKRITVLRSPHVNKKSREQLEIRLYSGLMILKCKSFSNNLIYYLSNYSNPAISIKLSFVTLGSSSCLN